MAKANISKEDMKKQSTEMFLDASAFNQMAGETYAGLNILKLEPGQAAGPITIVKILEKQDLKPGTGKKKFKPVDVYVGTFKGTEVRLPVSASLTSKLAEANVKPGDVIAILRTEDYISKQFGNRGAGYQLKVISRKK